MIYHCIMYINLDSPGELRIGPPMWQAEADIGLTMSPVKPGESRLEYGNSFWYIFYRYHLLFIMYINILGSQAHITIIQILLSFPLFPLFTTLSFALLFGALPLETSEQKQVLYIVTNVVCIFHGCL